MEKNIVTDSKSPDGYATETLRRNLQTLALTQPEMARRISWPVKSSHVLFTEEGRAFYRIHSSEYPLDLTAERTASVCMHAGDRREIFVFGIGLGEHIDLLLHRYPAKEITAWDKDPWLLRLFLMRRDYSPYLLSGMLRLALGIDLIDHVPAPSSSAPVFHPLLNSIYSNEAGLLVSGIPGKRVVVNTGGVLVDDVVQSLKKSGYTPFLVDLAGVSLEEIDYSLARFAPRLVFSVNYQTGLSELCLRHGLELLCWEVDPSIDRLAPLGQGNPRAHVFTYRKRNVKEYRAAGFANVDFLPLGANPERRKPEPGRSEGFEGEFPHPLSFVGSSMASLAREYLADLQRAYREYLGSPPGEPEGEEDPFLHILRLQSGDYSVYTVPELFRERLDGFREYYLEKSARRIDPIVLLAEVAACDKRLAYLSRLGLMGMKIWGDEGWKKTEPHGARYMGFSGHGREINRIYCETAVNIDISRLYQMDMVNMRVFDILACGAFLLAEHSEGIEELFEPGREIVTYRTLDELVQKAGHYLEHREEAREIAQRGMDAVKSRHTVKARVKEILRRLG